MAVDGTGEDGIGGPTFSVIIPVYNRARQLTACIASVRAQSLRDFELIVVDDGSTDGTCDMLVGADDLTVVTKANGGPASARNFGAEHAHGRYLFFLDSDDLAFRWTLASFAAAIKEHDAPDVVCGNFVEFFDLPPSIVEDPIKTVYHPDYFDAAANGLYAAGGMIAVKRDVFLEVGGFDVRMQVAEDHDLMLRLGERPGFIHIVSPPTYAKHDHAGSISKVLALFKAACSDLVVHLDSGHYGKTARARRVAGDMVGSHLRAATLTLARDGQIGDSFSLYRRSFALNLRRGRLKFLLATPALICLHGITRWRH